MAKPEMPGSKGKGRVKSNKEKGKPTFVQVCHYDDETGQYVPHKVRTDKYDKFMGNHPDDIAMPADGVCPIILVEEEVEDLPEVEDEEAV